MHRETRLEVDYLDLGMLHDELWQQSHQDDQESREILHTLKLKNYGRI